MKSLYTTYTMNKLQDDLYQRLLGTNLKIILTTKMWESWPKMSTEKALEKVEIKK